MRRFPRSSATAATTPPPVPTSPRTEAATTPDTSAGTTARAASRTARPVLWGARLLARYGIGLMQVSLGTTFLVFGALKFFPGASPAEDLVVPTVETLTFGLLTGGAAMAATAVVECFIGLTLITGKLLKTGLAVLAAALVGILSPLVLLFGELFPGGVPTLEAQYVFKDIVLAAGALVVAAGALGARLVPPAAPDQDSSAVLPQDPAAPAQVPASAPGEGRPAAPPVPLPRAPRTPGRHRAAPPQPRTAGADRSDRRTQEEHRPLRTEPGGQAAQSGPGEANDRFSPARPLQER
ncbi:hypothetical protein [Nocardiopsis potens]|uniref:hypothetical protein n=1 Tax=Nocardiopsis potens TaxID=1246458 RepID=UPI000344AB12|nr:hypothetical protein [Nocardiopsis potens]